MTTFDEGVSNSAGTENPLFRILPASDEMGAEIYQRALLLGVVAGLRSLLPIALLLQSNEGDIEEPDTLTARVANSPNAKTIASLVSLAEVVGDKLPFAPSRLKPGPFVGRLASGAIAGALFCRRYNQPLVSGALLGATGAALGTFAGYVSRTLLANGTPIPDFIWAALEDSAAIGLGIYAVKGQLPFSGDD